MDNSYKSEKQKIDRRLGQRIVLARKWRNISQDSLAAKAGLKAETLSKYENGNKSIPIDILMKIAQILSISFDYFFEPYSE